MKEAPHLLMLHTVAEGAVVTIALATAHDVTHPQEEVAVTAAAPTTSSTDVVSSTTHLSTSVLLAKCVRRGATPQIDVGIILMKSTYQMTKLLLLPPVAKDMMGTSTLIQAQ
jgi:hypothetical protein